MSRIHEALKKAEEERQTWAAPNPAAPGLKSQPDAAAPVMAVPLSEPVMSPPPPAAPQPAVEQVPPTFGLTWDVILARCTPRQWTPGNGMLFFDQKQHEGVGLEEFRTLRSRLYQIREKTPIKTLLIGSALPAEGKSFLAANLAHVLVRLRGRRALLIDADLRKPRLHEYLGASTEPGLTDYLTGDKDELGIFQRGPVENLVLISGGHPVANPGELIANGRFRQLIERVSPLFDWIIVDSPPVEPVSDATLIARACDGVLLVVQAASTSFDLAQHARKEFRGVPVLGVVLNRVPKMDGHGSYYHRYYSSYGKDRAQTGQNGNV